MYIKGVERRPTQIGFSPLLSFSEKEGRGKMWRRRRKGGPPPTLVQVGVGLGGRLHLAAASSLH